MNFFTPTNSAARILHRCRPIPRMSKSRKELLKEFLFSRESDHWLSVLRVGLGVHVILYALALQNDWTYLFGGAAEGLDGRALSEAFLVSQSPLVPRLSWLIGLAQS